MNANAPVGILFLCLGVFFFSVQDALLKGLSSNFPITQLMTVRAMISLPVLALIIHYRGGLSACLAPLHKILVLRASLSFCAFFCYYLALPAMPLADAIGLYYTAPLIIVILSSVGLGEKLTIATIASVLIGMAGVFVMVQPSTSAFDLAALLPIGSAFLYGSAQIIARRFGATFTAPTMAFYQTTILLIGAPLVAAFLGTFRWDGVNHPSIQFLTRPWVWSSLFDIGVMCTCALIALAGMLFLTQAYRLTSPSKAATFEYTGLFWAPLWGLLLFGEVLSITTVVGLLLISVAGLLAILSASWLRTRQARR